MANILYGVNGEGSGHSSRAREVIAHLEEQGHRVHVATFDRGYRNLKDDFDVYVSHTRELANFSFHVCFEDITHPTSGSRKCESDLDLVPTLSERRGLTLIHQAKIDDVDGDFRIEARP